MRSSNDSSSSASVTAVPAVPDGYTDLYARVLEDAGREGSLYEGTRRDEIRLLQHLEANSWFHSRPLFQGDRIFLPVSSGLFRDLPLWLKAYGRPIDEKQHLLLDCFREKLPQTCGLLSSFLNRENLWAREAALAVSDHLLNFLSNRPSKTGSASAMELDETLDQDLMELFISSDGYLNGSAFSLLQELIHSLPDIPGRSSSSWVYTQNIPVYIPRDNSAYSLTQTALLCWHIFNPAAFEEHDLIRKARQDREAACLWLYTALSFISAIRGTDITRLPCPLLERSAAETADAVLDPDKGQQEAVLIASLWEEQIRLLHMTPNKTARFDKVPELRLFIPESLKPCFGTMLALAAMGYTEGTVFIDCSPTPARLRALYGSGFLEACGGSFSIRRAAKAYLQGIQGTAPAGSAAGALIASFARSHKGSADSMAASTDYYLADSNFTGCTPKFVLQQMFDRGVFGFIPVLLLERTDQAAFRSLSAQGQTKLIAQLGLKPWQVEELCEACGQAFAKARDALTSFLGDRSGEDCEKRLRECMQGLCYGTGAAKTKHLYCLLSFADIPCACRDRASCIGCGYEIYTKAFLHQLMQEYVRLGTAARDAPPEEKKRLTALRIKGLSPVIVQFLETFPRLYPEADMEPFRAIVKRGTDAIVQMEQKED